MILVFSNSKERGDESIPFSKSWFSRHIEYGKKKYLISFPYIISVLKSSKEILDLWTAEDSSQLFLLQDDVSL